MQRHRPSKHKKRTRPKVAEYKTGHHHCEKSNEEKLFFHTHGHPPRPFGVLGRSARTCRDGREHYAFLTGADGGSGFGALSPIRRTLLSSSEICMPESASKSAGTCAAILVMSPVSLYAPAASPLPVETMVTLSTLLSGSARARTMSGNPVNSLSMTAAWLYSWKASAFTFMALASASPFLKMISASASPCARIAEARPSASVIER